MNRPWYVIWHLVVNVSRVLVVNKYDDSFYTLI